MLNQTKLLQSRLEKQSKKYQHNSEKIISLASTLETTSTDLYDKVKKYQAEWMQLLDLKTEQANIIWCRRCRQIKPADTAVHINTTGRDDDGESNFGFIYQCKECAEVTFANSPQYGKIDGRGRQASFVAYRMEKRNDRWYVMDGGTDGTATRPQDQDWIESCFKGYYTGRAGYNEGAIKNLAEYLSMPEQIDLTFNDKICYATIRKPVQESVAATA